MRTYLICSPCTEMASFALFLLFQSQWCPCGSLNVPDKWLSQDLCTCTFICMVLFLTSSRSSHYNLKNRGRPHPIPLLKLHPLPHCNSCPNPCFDFLLSGYNNLIIYIFVLVIYLMYILLYLISSWLEHKSHKSRNHWLFFSLLYPQVQNTSWYIEGT